MLASPVTREVSRTVLESTGRSNLDALLAEVFAELEAQATAEMLAEGTDADALVAERWIDARYAGQSFELRVSADAWVERFHDLHHERYGYRRPETPVEAVTLRVIVTAPPVPLTTPELPEASGSPPVQVTRVFHGGRDLEAVRVWRSELRAGHVIDGPAVVQEYSATTWVPPGWRLRVDGWGCLHLTPEG
jgi:N-methylhydantoinase A